MTFGSILQNQAAGVTVKSPSWHVVKHLRRRLIDGNAGYFHLTLEASAFFAHIHEGHQTGVGRLIRLRAACRCLQLSHVSCLPSCHIEYFYCYLHGSRVYRLGKINYTIGVSGLGFNCTSTHVQIQHSSLQMGAGLTEWDFMLIWNISKSLFASVLWNSTNRSCRRTILQMRILIKQSMPERTHGGWNFLWAPQSARLEGGLQTQQGRSIKGREVENCPGLDSGATGSNGRGGKRDQGNRKAAG